MKRLGLLLVLAGLLSACGAEEDAAVPLENRVVEGDAAQGRALMAAVGCGACHHVSDLSGARGVVGPSLDLFGRRALIAGQYPNRPGILAEWVQHAPRLDPSTAMPSMPLGEAEARHVAAYLYTLR